MPPREPIDDQGIYHVGVSGNFGQPLFTNAAEHELYLHLYARSASKFRWITLAWTLLWNHHHFLVELTQGGLSEGMRVVNHGFSRRMNAVYGRTGTGHLVRHAFFARRVTTDADLQGVCRYIDLNPVRAGKCSAPEDWPWSGYAATVGFARPRPFHDVRAQLSHFGDRPSRARQRYARLVTLPSPLPGKGDEPVTAPSAGRALEERDALDVRGVREHVDRPGADE